MHKTAASHQKRPGNADKIDDVLNAKLLDTSKDLE